MISSIIGLNEVMILILIAVAFLVAYLIYRLIKSPSMTRNTTQDNSRTDIVGQLERLGKLKEQGLINEEEFEQQKIKLLQKL
ncbi:MAG TPA: SHOCT domain-containing protein [Chitinophagaceae bacterium]|nr:SHOCT domain-containing protein [Chitinophagaceae bacterium]